MDIQVGQHVYRNTDGTMEIEGALQIEIALRGDTATPLLNFALFDGAGKMPAKLMKNHFDINEASAYLITKSSNGVTLTHPASGTNVLTLEVTPEKRVVISQGKFFTLKGHTLEITPKEWKIEKTTVGEGETDMKGKAACLG
ncbi:MAG: hypothetical protein O2999_00895 [Nitrospirae bacterium]|nr:hypothetical protein [Nitrospirota bacterium]MDA1302861.1 hypothetical protein [Nitrospirota bacterium]